MMRLPAYRNMRFEDSEIFKNLANTNDEIIFRKILVYLPANLIR